MAHSRELEKLKIREEIISGEFYRKQALVEEVKAEMRQENELRLRVITGKDNQGAVAETGKQEEKNLKLVHVCDLRNPLSSEWYLEELTAGGSTIPTMAEGVYPATPSARLSGTKRDSEIAKHGEVGESSSGVGNKRRMKLWKCNLCETFASSEEGLKAHLCRQHAQR